MNTKISADYKEDQQKVQQQAPDNTPTHKDGADM